MTRLNYAISRMKMQLLLGKKDFIDGKTSHHMYVCEYRSMLPPVYKLYRNVICPVAQNGEQPSGDGIKNQDDFLKRDTDGSEDQPDKANMEILKSPTGSGKTYAMLERAIKDASEGGIAVIAYPNLNLLNENSIALREKVPKEYNIEILEISMSEYMAGNTAVKTFESLSKGRLIVLTLHTYLTQRGDLGNYSTFFMLLQPFKSITSIYVDEAHLLFNSYQRNYPLTFLLYEDLGSYRIITSGFLLQDAIKKNKKIYISPQGLKTEQLIKSKEAGQHLGVKVTAPENSYDLTEGVSFFSNDAVKVSFNDIPDLKPGSNPNIYSSPENKNSMDLKSNTMFLKLSNTIQNDLLSINKSVGGLFLRLEDLKPVTSNNMLLETQYYDLFYLSITGDPVKDSQIKAFLTKYYHRFFNYNAYITIMRTAFPYIFDKDILKGSFDKEGNLKTVDLQSQIIKFNTELIDRIVNSFRTEYDNIDQIKVQIQQDIADLSYDFFKIFVKKYAIAPKKEIDFIYPETPIEALSMTYCLSTNTYLLNSKPFYKNKDGKPGNNITLSSFQEYSEVVQILAENQKDKKDKSKIYQDEAASDSDTETLSFEANPSANEANPSANPSANEANPSANPSVNPSANPSVNPSANPSIVYIKGSPFTSEFMCFYIGDFHKYKNFKSIKFFSATYSNPTLRTIEDNVQNIKFFEFITEQKKLDKLVLIKSGIDWFTNSSPEWKKNWKEFANFFYDAFSKDLPMPERKFGLFLAPSNTDAKSFIKYKIPKPDDRYSLVVAADENYVDFSSEDKTSMKETVPFSIKPTPIENRVIRVSSILSTVSVGLNMPEHSFILAAANSYKPVSVIWRYGDVPVADARNYETGLALVQAIGRNARRSAIEIEKNLYTARCALISKATVFPNTIETLADNSTPFYEQVEVIDITKLEALLVNIRSKTKLFSSYKLLAKFKDIDNNLYSNIFPFGLFEYSQDIRFSLLKDILLSIKNPNANNQVTVNTYLDFIYKYKIIAGCAYLSEIFDNKLVNMNRKVDVQDNNGQQKEQTTEVDEKPKPKPKSKSKSKSEAGPSPKNVSKSYLYRSLNLQRFDPYEKVAYENIFDLFIPYYNDIVNSEEAYKKEFGDDFKGDYFIHIFTKLFNPFLTENIFDKENFLKFMEKSLPNESDNPPGGGEPPPNESDNPQTAGDGSN